MIEIKRNIDFDLHEKLLLNLMQNSDDIAIITTEKNYTYGEFRAEVEKFQSFLISKHPDLKQIGIIASHDFQTYAAIIACILSGVTYIPLEPDHPNERNNHILKISEIDYIFSSKEINDVIFKDKIFSVNITDKEIQKLKIIKTNNPVYILFTSGTTGIPKGVPISAKNLNAFFFNIFSKLNFGISKQSRFLQVFDLTFDLSVFSMLTPLLAGCKLSIFEAKTLKNFVAIQNIIDNNITHILTVPTFVSTLENNFKKINLPKIEHWIFCGEALNANTTIKWQECIPNAKIWNVYGPTEATIFCTSYQCDIKNLKQNKNIVCIGKPFEKTVFKTLKNDYEDEELIIGGSQIFENYLKNDFISNDKFIVIDNEKYYKSSDIVTTDEDGNYFFLGRNDFQIKILGYRIELEEIEYICSKYDEIIQNATCVYKFKNTDCIGLAIVTNNDNFEIDKFLEYLNSNLPKQMIPAKIMKFESLPLNINNKIDRKALVSIFEND